MGNKVKEQAEKLGFINLPKTTLYARPKKVKMMFSKLKPDTVKLIGDYMRSIDPSFIETNSGGGRNNTFYLLAENAKLYVEIADKLAAFVAYDMSNHVEKIEIYCDKEDHIKKIANILNQTWEDGILPHIDWLKIEKKYKVNRQECIATWNRFLGPETQKIIKAEPPQEFKICERCGEKNPQSNAFCIECGNKF